ncbi:MAG: hypothetical protein Q4E76_01040 [Tissierellia bacterium]|nr:hypothetical protein [Tissierellia bacterium]
MNILDIFISIFLGTLLARFVVEHIVDAYVYIKRKLKDDRK